MRHLSHASNELFSVNKAYRPRIPCLFSACTLEASKYLLIYKLMGDEREMKQIPFHTLRVYSLCSTPTNPGEGEMLADAALSFTLPRNGRGSGGLRK